LITQDRPVAEKCRLCWIPGSAIFTTVASSTTISWQVTMTASARLLCCPARDRPGERTLVAAGADVVDKTCSF